jgi:hypothetical protein
MVNVSDTPGLLFQNPRVPYYWFPVQETGYWGYSPFFGAAKVYDHFKDSGKPLMIHCHGGVCRSPLVSYAINLAEGLTEQEMAADYSLYKGFEEHFQVHMDRGCIPRDIVNFLKARKQEPEYSIIGLLAKIGSPNLYLPTFKQRNAA